MRTWGKSRIRNKIIFRVMIIGTITLLVIFTASLLTLFPPLKEKAIVNAQNINSQVMFYTDYLLSDISDYAEDIISSSDFKSALNNYYNNPSMNQYYQIVCLNLNKLASMQSNIRNIIVELEDGTVFTSIVQIENSDLDLLDSNWYKTLYAIDYASGFSRVQIAKERNLDNFTAAYCKNSYLYNRRLTITIFFRVNEILYNTSSLAVKSLDDYLWLDSSYTPFYPSKTTEWSEKITQKLAGTTIYKSDIFEEFGGYNLVNVSEESGWIFVSFISENSLFNTFRGYFFTILLFILLFFLITVLVITLTLTSITKPIGQLALDMSKVANGNLDIVSTINTDDEIEDLSRIFNSMVGNLKNYVHRLLKKEELEQRMKYSLLISQINPHFIYNTMNTINYLARNGRNQDIIVINTALIKILQDRLRVKNIDIFDTVKQEINIIKQYIIIQRFRYGNNVKVIWDVDESLAFAKIPKNIIQPLVENSLFHGLTDEKNGQIKGCIRISIKSVENRIIVKVSDNGRGIRSNKLAQLNISPSSINLNNRGKHIGLANIRERLFYLYGNQDCMLIESTPFKGTCVTLILEPN